MSASATHRARRLTATLAQAEALADLVRDHGHPARVIVGRKRGTLRIKAADRAGATWRTHMLPVDRDAIRAWLGY